MKTIQKLTVSEIYAGITTETINSGVPAIFIRLSGHNLTIKNDPYSYTWDESNKAVGLQMTAKDIILAISKLKVKTNHLVITGGEPLLQDAGIIEVLKEYQFTFNKKPFVEIETCGTIIPSKGLQTLTDLFSVNIKLANSFSGSARDTFSTRIKNSVINYFNQKDIKSYFKFYIKDIGDSSELLELKKMFKIELSRIVLVPDGLNYTQFMRISGAVWNLCISSGFKFAIRTKFLIWGDKRGL
jgi:6-pyruvoyltetrahydropterin 2'-reductase